MLGEIPKKKGDVSITGSVAYVSQEAWIMNATVNKNFKFIFNISTNIFLFFLFYFLDSRKYFIWRKI